MQKSMAVSAKQILRLINKAKLPLTSLEIKQKFIEVFGEVDRSTVYRSLAVLLKEGRIVEVDFGDGKTRYEKSKHHHHHVVCKKCKKVYDLELPMSIEKELGVIEKSWRDSMLFTEISHSLEFFGKCNNCCKSKTNE